MMGSLLSILTQVTMFPSHRVSQMLQYFRLKRWVKSLTARNKFSVDESFRSDETNQHCLGIRLLSWHVFLGCMLRLDLLLTWFLLSFRVEAITSSFVTSDALWVKVWNIFQQVSQFTMHIKSWLISIFCEHARYLFLLLNYSWIGAGLAVW